METAEHAARSTACVDGQLGSLAIALTPEAETPPPGYDAEVPDGGVYIQYSHTATDAYPLTQMVRF